MVSNSPIPLRESRYDTCVKGMIAIFAALQRLAMVLHQVALLGRRTLDSVPYVLLGIFLSSITTTTIDEGWCNITARRCIESSAPREP